MTRRTALAFIAALTEEVEARPDRPISNNAIGAAHAYRIWCEGEAVGWNCTVAELAEATGIEARTVRAHCARRGWPVQEDVHGLVKWNESRHEVGELAL